MSKLFGQVLNVLDSIKREHEELLMLLFCYLENVLHSSKNVMLIRHNRILMKKIIISTFLKKKREKRVYLGIAKAINVH